MYCAGNYRDTVTRYNHKDVNRWMGPVKGTYRADWFEAASWAVIAVCTALALACVMMLIKAA